MGKRTVNKTAYWLYMIECDNGSLYTGYTVNLTRRYRRHLSGKAGAKYTRSFRPVRIVCCWLLFCGKSTAMKMEGLVKRMSRERKERLVRNPRLLAGLAPETEGHGAAVIPMKTKARRTSRLGTGSETKGGPLVLAALLVLGAAFAPMAGASAAPLKGDRPGFTGSAVCVPFGSVQVETGFTYSERGRETIRTFGNTLVRSAVVGRLELRLGFNNTATREAGDETVFRRNDGYAGIKLGLLRNPGSFVPWRPDFSISVGTTLPTKSSEYEENIYQPDAALLAGWPLAQWLYLGAAFRYSYLSEYGQRYERLAGGVSADFRFFSWIEFFTEYYMMDPEHLRGGTIHYVNGGIKLRLMERVKVDARFGYGEGDETGDVFFGLGAVARFTNVY